MWKDVFLSSSSICHLSHQPTLNCPPLWVKDCSPGQWLHSAQQLWLHWGKRFSVFLGWLQVVHWGLVGVQQDLWRWHAHQGCALHQENWPFRGGDPGLQRLFNTSAYREGALQQPVLPPAVGDFGLVRSKTIERCVFWAVWSILTKAFTCKDTWVWNCRRVN